MTTKPTLVMLCLLIAVPAQAGGFLADTLIRPFSPDIAKQLDAAHQNLGRALDQDSAAFSVIGKSKTCVTTLGTCQVSSEGLNGTACFCEFDKKSTFGRIQ